MPTGNAQNNKSQAIMPFIQNNKKLKVICNKGFSLYSFTQNMLHYSLWNTLPYFELPLILNGFLILTVNSFKPNINNKLKWEISAVPREVRGRYMTQLSKGTLMTLIHQFQPLELSNFHMPRYPTSIGLYLTLTPKQEYLLQKILCQSPLATHQSLACSIRKV